MFRSIEFIFLLFVLINCVDKISSTNLNGIFTVDFCECSSKKENCEPLGPFLFDQNQTKLTIKFGPTQIGNGLITKKGLDINMNQTHCKGSWNIETHIAELQCEHHDGIICATNLRCVVGACLTNQTLNSFSSSAPSSNIFFYSTLTLFFVFLFIK